MSGHPKATVQATMKLKAAVGASAISLTCHMVPAVQNDGFFFVSDSLILAIADLNGCADSVPSHSLPSAKRGQGTTLYEDFRITRRHDRPGSNQTPG